MAKSPGDSHPPAAGECPAGPPGSFSQPRSEEQARGYLTAEMISEGSRRRRHDRIERDVVTRILAGLPPGALLADMPCGNGRAQGWIERPDLRVIALDLNETMLSESQRRRPPESRAHLVQGNILALPLPDKSVDVFLNLRLSHHIPDDETLVAMFREIARATRSRVVTTFQSTHCLHYLKRRFRRRKAHHIVRSPGRFRAACRQAGLVIEEWIPVRRFRQEDMVVVCRIA